MSQREISRRPSKQSNNDEDNISIDERQLLESFRTIADIFENELEEEKAAARSKSASEDADSVDEEVRRIMSKDGPEEDKSEPMNKDDSSDDEDGASTVLTETESESESDQELTDSEDLDDDDSKASEDDRYPIAIDEDEDETEQSELEFDLDKYIDKLCLQSTDEEESDDDDVSDSDSMFSKDTKKAVKKVMRKVSKDKGDGDNTATESERDSDEETISNPDVDRDELTEVASGDEGDLDEGSDDDDSSYGSSGESEISDFIDDDDDDDDDSSTGTSQNGDDVEESHDSETSLRVDDVVEILSPTNDPDNQLHDTVRKYYQGLDRERCPAKLDVHEYEIGHMKLDNTLSSRNVVSLRWPFSNYYVKEVEVAHDEQDEIFDEGLLPTYKSMQTSSSFPGRRRNVMSGRVWWVEWWASNLSDSDRSVDDLQGKDGNDELPEMDDDSLSETAQMTDNM